MARIPLTTQQVGIRAGGGSMIRTPTETTDSQLLQQGVDMAVRYADRLGQQQKAVKGTQYMTDFVNSQTALSQQLNDAQQKSRTGVDYIPASQEIIKKHQEQFFTDHPGLTDDERSEYTQRWAQANGQLQNQAINWGQAQGKRIQASNLEDSAAAIGNTILQNPDSAKSLAVAHLQAIEQSDLDPAAKAELASKSRNTWAMAAAQYGILKDPQHIIDQHGDFQATQGIGAGDGSSSPAGSSGTLANRNNNPLNIRYSDANNWAGKGGDNGTGFEQFDTADHGFRAGLKLIRNHISNGKDTISSLVRTWAPKGDGSNNPVQYAQGVSKDTGIPLDQRLNPDDPKQMTAIARAMSKQEGYAGAVPDSQLQRAWSSLADPNQLAPGVPWGQLTPQQTYSVMSQAETKIRQNQAIYRQQLEPVITNTLAQLNNGDVPESLPDKASIIRAYGEKAPNVIKQIDAAASNAKVFANIQGSSPAEQQAALQAAKPKANDPDYAIKLDAYGKLTSLVKRSNDQAEALKDAATFNSAITTGEKLDPSNKAMQTAADGTLAARSFVVSDQSTHDAVVQQVAQTGIMPSKVESQLTAVARSRSPEAVKQGADLFNRLYETDMSSVGNMPKDMQSFYLTIQQLTGSGMDPTMAIEQAQNATFNQSDALKAQLTSTQSTAAYKKDRTKATEAAVSDMSQWFRADPSASDETPETVRFRNDYNSLYDVNYRLTGGSADVARKMTNQQISANWAISEVNGNAAFMKYAPEVMARGGPPGWQSEQWNEEKSVLMYGDGSGTTTVSAASLGITSGRGSFVQGSDRKARIDGDLEVTSDVLTPSSGDYAIIVKSKDKNGLETARPLYDDDGRAMRWKPSLQDWKPYQDMQKESLQEQQDQITRGQNIRALKDKRRALDEQYQQFHDERVDKLNDYFSWSK